jgi:ferredoxin-fold anticodon binding domain-containing protein|tara:strand:+ start:60 stop:1031 length:972 start_codon:yes stop_codon:yes gene_type:complete
MRKALRIIVTFGILLVGNTIFGQEFIFNIHEKNISEIRQIEDSLGSEKIPNESYYSMSEIQPISFRRKEKNIPDLIVQYEYKKDSTLKEIWYEWDVYNFDKKSNNRQSLEFQKALIEKYLSIKSTISEKFGASIEDKGDLSKLDLINDKGGLKKSDLWKPNDSTEIEMYTVLSNYYEKKGMVTSNPTHRIRLFVKNTKKIEKETPKLDKKRIDSLQMLSKNFLRTLSQNELVKSKEYLSDLIKQSVTDEQLNILIENLDFDRAIELVYSGIQAGLDGSIFAMLQFKYKNDVSNPPNELIKIIFDNKNKVVGIQPIKLQGKATD